MGETGVRRGAPPTLAEIEHARDAVTHPSYFGALLQDIMLAQQQACPNLRLPWLVPALCEQVIRLGGLTTEGIFRSVATCQCARELSTPRPFVYHVSSLQSGAKRGSDPEDRRALAH